MQRSSNPQIVSRFQPGSARAQRDGGYLLLAIMLMMALMIIAATIAAPRVVQQIKRDREEEMIHRGVQYARAIKRFYKKNGRYPSTLDDLDKGQIKYLRQRYKDPLTKDGKWKLLNYADIATMLNTAAPGTPAASLGTLGGGQAGAPGSAFSNSASPVGGNFAQSPLSSQQQQQQQNPGFAGGGFTTNSDQGGSSESFPGTTSGNTTGSSGGGFTSGSDTSSGSSGNSQSGSSSSPGGGTTSGASGSNNQTQFGGGAIVGVASLSKDPTIRIYNKKKTYNEWQFIYNPMMDTTNTLIKTPYQPTTIGGSQVGTPASQMNGQQQNNQSPFGQQGSSPFGQQNNNFGNQNGVGTTSPQPTSSP